MSCYLDKGDRKHLVKHYINRAHRLASDEDLRGAMEALGNAQKFAVDNDDHQSIKKTLIDIWLTLRWSHMSVQLQKFPLPLKTREIMNDDIDKLSELKAVDIFIDAAVQAARDEEEKESFVTAFSVLLNAADLAGQQKWEVLCSEIQDLNRTRLKAFEKAVEYGEKLLQQCLNVDDCKEQGEKAIHAMNQYMLPDEILEQVIEFCKDDPSYWEGSRNDRQKVSDYEAKLHEIIKRKRKQDRLQKVDQLLQELWAAPSLSLGCYRQAVAESAKLLDEYPGDAAVRSWHEEAMNRLSEARVEVQALISRAHEGDFVPLVNAYRNASEERRCGSLPWIEKDNDGYILQEENLVSAQKALAQVERLAQAYADEKADKLLNDSKDLLQIDATRAKRLIDNALNLPYLSDDMRSELTTFHRDEVIPSITSQKEADRLIKQAKKKFGQKKTMEAWTFLKAARHKAPRYVDESPIVKNELYPHMRVYWKGLLRSARNFLWKNELDKAARKVHIVLEQTRGVPHFQECFAEANELLEVIVSQYEQEDVSQ